MDVVEEFYGQHDVCYRGTEIKFHVELACSGFDMDTDDWDLKMSCGKKTVTIEKRGEYAEGDELPEGLAVEDGEWYVYIDTSQMPEGLLKVVAKAYVVDKNASGGIREEVDKQTLCHLCNP